MSRMGLRRARWAISRSESMGRSPGVAWVGGLAPARILVSDHLATERLDLHRADLVLRYLGDRIARGIGEEVGRRVGELHERDEDGPRPHGLGELGVPR